MELPALMYVSEVTLGPLRITPVTEATNARKSVAFSDRIARLDCRVLISSVSPKSGTWLKLLPVKRNRRYLRRHQLTVEKVVPGKSGNIVHKSAMPV